MSDLSCSFGRTVKLTANLYQRSGYSFNGWNTAADGSGTQLADRASVLNLGASAGTVVTLYAQWQPAAYRIRFNANRGSGSMAELDCVYDRASALPACGFSRAGYVFTGWNTRSNGSGVPYNAGDEVMNLTCSTRGVTVLLYAQWAPISYTLRYNANGGSGSMADQRLSCGVKTALRANVFTRSGYSFNGWNTMPDGSGLSFKNGASVQNLAWSQGAVVTLYAQWKEISCKLRFVSNGGSGSMAMVSCGADGVTLPACGFSRKGYVFAGWNTAANGSGTSYSSGQTVRGLSDKSGATVRLYAQWTPISYSVVFSPNGGSGSMAPQGFRYGVGAQLSANAFSRSGYVFTGWNTMPDGSGRKYANRKIVSNLCSDDGAYVILYAQWRAV